MKRKALLLALAALCLGGAASAQLGGVSLPSLPVGPALEEVTQAPGVAGAAVERARDVAPRALRAARRLEIRALLRAHADVLEADPAGAPIVRGEILAVAPSAAALAAAQAQGFTVVRTDALEDIGALVSLRAPEGVTTAAALRMLRRGDPQGVYDFDHLHQQTGAAGATAPALAAASGAGEGLRVGLIDGGVGAHPSLSGAIAEQRSFAGAAPTPSAHATAVASLLAGRGAIVGAAPAAQIFAADIYGGAPTGGSAASLARALSWLAGQRTPVINVSLVGPRNRIVEAMVAALVGRGYLIVAAVGNDGPAAPPLYPAAYPGVVGVTGVDERARVLMEAERGPQVDFAAAGTPFAAAPDGAGASVRGTSYAAPIVAGLLAERLRAPDPAGAQRALQALRAGARDLGARGRDDVYGDGLVGASFLTARAP